jgi:hypothetical protein
MPNMGQQNVQQGKRKGIGVRGTKGNAERAVETLAAPRAAAGRRQPTATRARGKEGQRHQPPARNHTTRPLAHHPTAASQQQQPSSSSSNQRPRQARISAASSKPRRQGRGREQCQAGHAREGAEGHGWGPGSRPIEGFKVKCTHAVVRSGDQPHARNSTPRPTVGLRVNALRPAADGGPQTWEGRRAVPLASATSGALNWAQPTARRHTTANARRGWVATPSKPSAGPSTGPHQQGDATHRAAPTSAPPSNTRSGPQQGHLAGRRAQRGRAQRARAHSSGGPPTLSHAGGQTNHRPTSKQGRPPHNPQTRQRSRHQKHISRPTWRGAPEAASPSPPASHDRAGTSRTGRQEAGQAA